MFFAKTSGLPSSHYVPPPPQPLPPPHTSDSPTVHFSYYAQAYLSSSLSSWSSCIALSNMLFWDESKRKNVRSYIQVQNEGRGL
ncbi:hypothetical protein E2C01_045734 [Portunus trituberculatus]|uniref:Uncharacterized protein n=1 Tax=Portunus trituberculatus TaxID=210409 RepID=A0A5B7G2U5_PORTR|nr:hypothetical protein [Portunus trituberculatus]